MAIAVLEVLLAATCALTAVLVVLQVRESRRQRKHRLPYPPGPKGAPLIGNLLQLPQQDAWKFHGTETLSKYGDVSYFNALGQPIIVLNSYEASFDLLARRSAIYSDRPRLPMVGEVMGMDQSTAFCHYGPYWRSQRRVWQQYMGIKNVLANYTSMVHTDARQFVARVLKSDKDIYDQLKLWVVKGLMGAAFGKKVDSVHDEMVTLYEIVTHEVAESMTPGKFLVDLLPFMKYIPAWLPGAGWKRMGLDVRDRLVKMGNDPYEHVKNVLSSGEAPRSFLAEMIEHPYADEHSQKWITASVYAAGVETTHEAINAFVVNMMAHPEVQRRAQEEIDRVVGRHRLPSIEDKKSLPYIDAIIQEVLRWHMILPFSVPQSLVRDDEYRGYFIPKGAMILSNSWAISRDPEMYPDPEEFRPDRFIVKDGVIPPRDPRLYCFGIGRRVCPGRHFAEVSLFTGIATLLATSTIKKPLDAQGVEYMPKIEVSGNGLSVMHRFDARIEARSSEARALLHEYETVA